MENLNHTVESLLSATKSGGPTPDVERRLNELEEDVRKIKTSENDELDELYDTVLESKREQNSKIAKLEKDLKQKSIDFENYHEHEKNADLVLAKKIQEIEKDLEKEKNDLANFQSEVGHGDLEFITKKIVDMGNDLEKLYQEFEVFKNEEFTQEERLESVLRRAELMKESIVNLQKTDEDFLFRLVDVETRIQDGYNPSDEGSSSVSINQIRKVCIRYLKIETNSI